MSSQTDRELIESIRRGEDKPFRELAERYLPMTYRFLARMMHDSHNAEDVTQEVFIKVWKHLSRFDVTKSFKTWLFTIARRSAIDHIRKKQPIAFSDLSKEDDDAVPLDVADERPLISEELEQRALAEEIDQALQKLPPDSRSVVLLHDAEDLTFQEIADAVKEPMNTVKSRYRRAIFRLRVLLSDRLR